jgi:hypothetical protein
MAFRYGFHVVRSFIILFIFIAAFSLLALAEERIDCGHVIAAVTPIYSYYSYLTGSSGKIQIAAEVNSEGDVIGTKVLDTSHPYLRKDSENAARQWKFSPQPGQPNPRQCIITFYYRIMSDQTPEEELTSVYHYPLEIEVRSKAKARIHEELPAANHK